MELSPTAKLSRCEIHSRFGAGGMEEAVFKARGMSLDRIVVAL